MIVDRHGKFVTGLTADNKAGEKKLGPCSRCAGRGTITVDSGTTLSGPAEREFRNKTVICPECLGLPPKAAAPPK
jgi:hypothetical protein